MPSDLRTRLQRLRPAARKTPPAVPPSVLPEVVAQRRAHTLTLKREQADHAALPGRELSTSLGAFQLIEERYPLSFTHGPRALVEAFAGDSAIAAQLARAGSLAASDLRTLAFLDTETTGLVGGAGTLVFLVGVGVCDGDEFVLRQYFLRDPAEEEALLTQLVSDVAGCAGWVTFNGKSFDVPLLETRLILNRMRGALGQRPHLDLLMPARRLYRGRLASCSLGSLEQNVLRILREQDDVPGEFIPQMYQDYLRTRDAREMRRVIYHNAIDILSMVTLMAHVLEVFASGPAPANPKSQTPNPKLNAEDVLRLAKWHADNGRLVEAEAAYKQALAGQLSLEARAEGLRRFALLLKRQDRRAEAAPLWDQLASFTLDDPEPFVELAKHHEWHTRDVALALTWTERALKVLAAAPKSWQRDETLAELNHRRARLKGKLGE
jgi:uncharacterized protein YprB with RNaseH-like and TPR domain